MHSHSFYTNSDHIVNIALFVQLVLICI